MTINKFIHNSLIERKQREKISKNSSETLSYFWILFCFCNGMLFYIYKLNLPKKLKEMTKFNK